MDRFQIYSRSNDYAKSLQLIGLAVTGVIGAIGYVDGKLIHRQKAPSASSAPTTQIDSSVLDFSQTRNAH